MLLTITLLFMSTCVSPSISREVEPYSSTSGVAVSSGGDQHYHSQYPHTSPYPLPLLSMRLPTTAGMTEEELRLRRLKQIQRVLRIRRQRKRLIEQRRMVNHILLPSTAIDGTGGRRSGKEGRNVRRSIASAVIETGREVGEG